VPSDWASSLDLLVDLNRGDGVRKGIEEALRSAIRDGRLPMGARLPSSRALAHDFNVARGTVSAAYDQLAAEGYLTVQQGAVNRVAWVPTGPSAGPRAAEQPVPAWDLRPGRADSSSFPRQAWSRATRRVLQHLPDGALDYGSSTGTHQLREALASYLGRARAVRTDPGQVVVCAGFTQTLGVICQALRDRGAVRVAMEDPNAPRYRGIVRQAGLQVVAIPCDEDGIRVSELDRRSADAVLVTPAHQYPLGVTLSPHRRSALIEWACAHDALIIEDDYDGEFRFDRRPVGAVQQMDPTRVIYAGTASKTLAPGLRLGWLTAPPIIREAIAAAKERLDRGNGVLDQLVLAELIGSGEFDRHVRRMRTSYRARRDALRTVVEQCGGGLRVAGIAAGLHALIPMPDQTTERRVLAAAAERGVMIHSLAEYWHSASPARPHAVIVGYGTPAGHAFRPALDALAAALAGPWPGLEEDRNTLRPSGR